MFTQAPEFRIWLQRDPDGDPPFRLRWQVMGGRGTLLLPRGGGTDAAPATPSGTLSDLSPASLEEARFIVVSDRSGGRNQFSLGPFEPESLHGLGSGAWTTLTMNQAGTALVLPAGPPPAENTPSQAEEAPDQDRIRELKVALAAAQQEVLDLTHQVQELEGRVASPSDSPGPDVMDIRPRGG